MTVELHQRPDGAALLRAALLDLPHAFSTRLGGVSDGRYASLNLGPRSGDLSERVTANRGRFLTAAGVDGALLLAPRQVHSATVAVYRAGDPLPERHTFDGDGVVTDAPGTALMVLAADCAAVLLHDPVRGVIAAAHAGWRGTAGGIAPAAVACMTRTFGCDPGDIRAAIGPSIGRCCYEVGPEVVQAIDAATPGGAAPLTDPRPNGKALIDIAGANAAQLLHAGLQWERLAVAAWCTACRLDLFYSHRKEGEPTGRNGAVIALR